ncbi:uncharacterized protein [Choristoneura fumiferana]|uniref:uncharacterized protein n=1 Tax=Choristoneura fumiferana TaxID=7141 RepID=UPI003D1545D0
MPKRGYDRKIERYARKIRRLEEKQDRRRHRIISSSDSEENTDNEQQITDNTTPPPPGDPSQTADNADQDADGGDQVGGSNPETLEPGQAPTAVPELDPDILLALGEATEETPRYGEKIHEKLAGLWLPILRKGLNKEAKVSLMKQFLIPENCTLLHAPKLNAEISAAVSDSTRLRDKRVESVQQQLGTGITALNKGLSLLLDGDKDRIQAIKYLSDSCRILCDAHFIETEARKKFVTPGLDKSFLTIIQEVDRDEMLFGSKLSEKIKASKAIEKQGLQIKKSAPVNKIPSTSTTQASTANRLRSQVNWSGPPRYTSSRGGRGGPRRTQPAGRRAPQAPATRSQSQAKPRAPTQQ